MGNTKKQKLKIIFACLFVGAVLCVAGCMWADLNLLANNENGIIKFY